MSGEEDKNKEKGKGTEEGKGQEGKSKSDKIDLTVNLENKSLEEVIERLKKEEAKRKETEEALTKLQEKLTGAEEELEKKTTEAESHRSKLQLIAEQKFNEKKQAIEAKAKALIKDEERLKAVIEKVESPEDLQATEFMLETLAKALETGQQEMNKIIDAEKKKLLEQFPDSKDKIEGAKSMEDIDALKGELKPESAGKGEGASAGSVPLSGQTSGGEGGEKGYESYEAMIRDLRRRERSSNPEEAAEAKEILDTLFKKWVNAVKQGYKGRMAGGLSVELEKQPSVREMTGQAHAQELARARKKGD